MSEHWTFLRLLNESRRDWGLFPVAFRSELSGPARTWSKEMAQAGRISHTDGQRMKWEVASVEPQWQLIGENVGVGWDAPGLHVAFWNSPGHRDNMLGQFNQVGIGSLRSGDGRLWVTFRYVRGREIAGWTGLDTAKSGFPDVHDSTYYADAVGWLRRKGITTGVGELGLFAPNSAVTRAQMATFLWRLAGRPRASAPRFNDVPQGTFYSNAVDWLRAKRLTTGVGNNLFRPNEPLKRDQAVTFLHRYAGSPSVPRPHSFTDVNRASFAERAVSWAAYHGITTGFGRTNLFVPEGVVSRGQMAAFLYRMGHLPASRGPNAQPIA